MAATLALAIPDTKATERFAPTLTSVMSILTTVMTMLPAPIMSVHSLVLATMVTLETVLNVLTTMNALTIHVVTTPSVLTLPVLSLAIALSASKAMLSLAAQTLTSVPPTPTNALLMLPAPTHLVHTTVHATLVTLVTVEHVPTSMNAMTTPFTLATAPTQFARISLEPTIAAAQLDIPLTSPFLPVESSRWVVLMPMNVH